MKDLITEARELCEKWSLSDYAVFECEDCIANMVIYKVVELCDALEKAEAYNAQLVRELSALARESIEREKVLAKLEAEVTAIIEPNRGEWVEAKSGVMSVWPPGQVMCSVCGQRMPSQWKKMPPYCYGCGAKMESEGNQ